MKITRLQIILKFALVVLSTNYTHTLAVGVVRFIVRLTEEVIWIEGGLREIILASDATKEAEMEGSCPCYNWRVCR